MKLENNKYSQMQMNQYEKEALTWSVDNKNPVVGGFDEHNNWSDYEQYLFKDIQDLKLKTCLDFGCGPGRNLVKFSHKFAKMDGVDIAQNNLEKAKLWISHNQLNIHNFNLYKNNGYDLSEIENHQYDIVMSTICFQHICVYEIRYNLLKEIFRILKPNGFITFQMGFGEKRAGSVSYYDNNYDAISRNSACDTRIEKVEYIQNDLNNIGFQDFKYYLTNTGPGDSHENWIFFNAKKI